MGAPGDVYDVRSASTQIAVHAGCANAHRQHKFACGGNLHKGKKAPLCVLPKLNNASVRKMKSPPSISASLRASRLRKNIRGHKAVRVSPRTISCFEVETPQGCNNMSWLQRRPLKPGSVAWLVAIRRANAGQRESNEQAVPDSTQDAPRWHH